MSAKPLKSEEIAAIAAVYYACGGSIKAHQPLQFIRNKFEKSFRPYAKEILEKVVRRPEQYVQKHKNREVTYSITLNGIKLLEDMNIIPRKR